MRALELKMPPPVLALALGMGMWGIAQLDFSIPAPRMARLATAAILALVGVAVAIGAVASFWRAGTTINPTKPETTSALVRSGVYRLTRNPIYLGDVFLLLAWAVFLSSVLALLGPLAFALYIDRFQILPEERALAKKFGAEYAAYRAKVRRWL